MIKNKREREREREEYVELLEHSKRYTEHKRRFDMLNEILGRFYLSLELDGQYLLDLVCLETTFRLSYKMHELLTVCEHLGAPPDFGGIRVAPLFRFLCCMFYFVCLRPVSCITNVASVSGLPILDCPFEFL